MFTKIMIICWELSEKYWWLWPLESLGDALEDIGSAMGWIDYSAETKAEIEQARDEYR